MQQMMGGPPRPQMMPVVANMPMMMPMRPMMMAPVVRVPVASPAIAMAPGGIAGAFMVAPQRVMMSGGGEDEPPSKKVKTEEQLVPEDKWLRDNQTGPVVLRVAVPHMPDKPEYTLTGQTLTMSLPLTDTVSVIKAKLADLINMPVGKQKLTHDGMFIKDSNTLAFYYMSHGSTIQLALKERGGRKK